MFVVAFVVAFIVMLTVMLALTREEARRHAHNARPRYIKRRINYGPRRQSRTTGFIDIIRIIF